MKESTVLKKVWLVLSNYSSLFRLNTGQAWVGNRHERLQDGTVAIPFGRPISVGLGTPNGKSVKGAADLIGWTTKIVTSDMVGSKVAIFTSVETKREKTGKITTDQESWCKIIKDAGGIAIITNSDAGAEEQLVFERDRYGRSRG